MRLPNSQEKNLSWVFALNHNPYKEKIELDFVHDYFFSSFGFYLQYTLPVQKKNHTFENFVEPPLALIMACIRRGIISISFCNVTTFIPVQLH